MSRARILKYVLIFTAVFALGATTEQYFKPRIDQRERNREETIGCVKALVFLRLQTILPPIPDEVVARFCTDLSNLKGE